MNHVFGDTAEGGDGVVGEGPLIEIGCGLDDGRFDGSQHPPFWVGLTGEDAEHFAIHGHEGSGSHFWGEFHDGGPEGLHGAGLGLLKSGFFDGKVSFGNLIDGKLLDRMRG